MSKLATLTLFHGGTFASVLRKTADATAQAAAALAVGEQVLYVNTLTSEARAEHEIRKACRRHGGAAVRRRILLLTVPSDALVDHEDFIERTIESRNVRLMVLSSFDFAAMSARRKTRLVSMLLCLRNFQNVELVTGLRLDPSLQVHGAVGHLVYQAERIIGIEELDSLDFALGPVSDVEEDPDGFDTIGECGIVLWQRPSERAYMASKRPLQNESLKTKDLPSLRVRTVSEFLNEVAATES